MACEMFVAPDADLIPVLRELFFGPNYRVTFNVDPTLGLVPALFGGRRLSR
jgi:hypothetical protein